MNAPSSLGFLPRRIATVILATTCSFAALAVAQAQPIRATPADNVAIGIVHGSAATGHAALVIAGLLPGPFGTPAEVGALTLDLCSRKT
jgi:hypothetical protein